MNIFKSRTDNAYLVTNLKVMYSTLTMQDSIVEVAKDVKLMRRICLSRLGLWAFRFDLVVRDPYTRLESFFKNKFRKTLPKILATGKWQYCHEIFFEYLDLDIHSSPERIVETLSKISFDEFIALLPKTFNRDGHLYPQSWALGLYYLVHSKTPNAQVKKIGMSIRYTHVYKIESKEQMSQMAALYNLDLSIKENSTASVDAPAQWTDDSIAIVDALYHQDLDSFGYERKGKIVE